VFFPKTFLRHVLAICFSFANKINKFGCIGIGFYYILISVQDLGTLVFDDNQFDPEIKWICFSDIE
jgi:hypothetical protein